MKIALLGNPNTGKSSVFNLLTGLRQQVGNFPGVTVDKRSGFISVGKVQHELIDFPGTYSIYPRSKEESVVYDVLSNPNHSQHPDQIIFVVDASNLQRNLLFFSQVYDLGIPCVLVLNMWDLAQRKGMEISIDALGKLFPSVPIVQSNARIGLGKDRIIDTLAGLKNTAVYQQKFIEAYRFCSFEDVAGQKKEAEIRLQKIKEALGQIVQTKTPTTENISRKIDRFLVHPIWGYLIFAFVLMTIFQFIFTFANAPMNWIDQLFSYFSTWSADAMPPGMVNDLISEGIIPGIGGVVVFVPQIAMLFFFISILEESGYLSRVVFIMDRLMRPFGLNGKSVVPLMSSIACAIPGIMATRTISNWKERLITILVAPFMSCSARIPVYTLLISLVIPKSYVLGFINLQGLVLFGLYSLGIVFALLVSFLLKLFIKQKERGFLLLELPDYKNPRWGNVFINVLEKVKIFILDAGKIILAISILLWFLASFGPNMNESMHGLSKTSVYQSMTEKEQTKAMDACKLSNSYIGILGKGMEPVISPLGYDWKIGISLITSFAAREVFVGSLATIYAVQDDGEDQALLIDRMRNEVKADGTPVFTLASGVSLMVFYVFAMQCMATMAVVKRETNSWKWPIIQLVFMGALAYVSAWITFAVLS
ncbi:MAG: ferrous iron transport protein [Bacteroidota bacterium]|jgi:ferrous iron transport protein B